MIKIKYLFIALSMLVSVISFSQSVNYLNFSPDATNLALGGSGVSNKANSYALFNNPASMSLSERKMDVALSYGNWAQFDKSNSLFSLSGYGLIGKRIGIGLSARYLMQPSFESFDENGNLIGTISPKDYSLDLAASYLIVDGLSFGATLRYIGSDLGGVKKGNAFGVDFGLQYKIKDFTLGVSYTNLGSKIDYGYNRYSLPSLLKLGASYSHCFNQRHNLGAFVQGDYYVVSKGFAAGAGLEYGFNNMIFLRAGYHYGDSGKTIPSYASVGLGLQFIGIALNASYLISSTASPLNNSFSVSLGWGF